ncbi:hypothetical protein, partial [Escherichia coli]
VTLVWGISPRQPSGKNIIRWLLKKRTNGSVRYCQYTSIHYGTSYLDSNICEHAICPVVMGLNVCSLMEGKRAAQI